MSEWPRGAALQSRKREGLPVEHLDGRFPQTDGAFFPFPFPTTAFLGSATACESTPPAPLLPWMNDYSTQSFNQSIS